MSLPSPRAVELDMAEVDRLRALLGNDPDIKLLLDSIEGETNAFEKLDRFVERLLADKALITRARARAKRIEQRDEHLRTTVLAMLEKFGVPKIERPLYTASVSMRSKVEVIEPDEIPDDFLRVAPDKIQIGKELRKGHAVPGAVLSNPAPVLTIYGEPGEPEEPEE